MNPTQARDTAVKIEEFFQSLGVWYKKTEDVRHDGLNMITFEGVSLKVNKKIKDSHINVKVS